MGKGNKKGFAARFRVAPGDKVKLGDLDPRDTAGLADEEATKVATAADAAAIDRLQDKLYAEHTRSLLVVLQGMDTAGKDGTIRGVFNTAGPIGVSVTPFKRPSELEADHDFLWRAHLAAPRRGTIALFNRSHYEDVLVVKVHELAPKAAIEARYDLINAFEKLLHETGTRILKFMLHISKKEQGERLQERLDDPDKHWKFNPDDLADRQRWGDFQDAYQTMLRRCSTAQAPWFVVPADRKWVRNAVIARIVRETLEEMDPAYPPPTWKPGAYSID